MPFNPLSLLNGAASEVKSLGGGAIRTAIANASQSTGIDFNYLLGQAKLESGLRADAKAGTSSATGLYQFVDQSWLRVVKAHGADIKSSTTIIATGSEVVSPEGVIIDEIDILSSTGALSLFSVPKHLMVIGSGYIGLEMGSVWSRLGSKVTVIEYADRILPGMDQEISDAFQKILIKQGFDFKLSTALRKVNKSNGSLSVSVENNGQTLDMDCDKVLISTGRKPYTFGLNLEKIGVKTNDKGFIETNQHFNTSIENIYAIGDCKVGPMLAHKASEEGTAVAEIIDGQAGHVNYNTIPSVIYTAPEVASVGKTEEELKKNNITYKIGKFPFSANGKAKVMNETSGFVKILSDKNTDEVLGVHIIGADAGNLIGELTIAMEFGASAEDIARTCHAHPTLTESIKEAALNVDNQAIHI